MSDALVSALIVAGATLVPNLIAAAYVYGKLAKDVSNTRGWLASVARDVGDHETRISHIEGAHSGGRANGQARGHHGD